MADGAGADELTGSRRQSGGNFTARNRNRRFSGSADKLKEPILLIHGQDDNNPSTFPIQSSRMCQALAGTGGNVRNVTLPFESHGYNSRESIAHTLR